MTATPYTPAVLQFIREQARSASAEDIALHLGWGLDWLDRVCRRHGIELPVAVARPVPQTESAPPPEPKARASAVGTWEKIGFALSTSAAAWLRASAAAANQSAANFMRALIARKLADRSIQQVAALKYGEVLRAVKMTLPIDEDLADGLRTEIARRGGALRLAGLVIAVLERAAQAAANAAMVPRRQAAVERKGVRRRASSPLSRLSTGTVHA